MRTFPLVLRRLARRVAASALSPPVVLLLFPLIRWGPSFLGRVEYLDDTLIFSMPLKMEWAAQVRAGMFPFWSEKIGAGYPVFAESQIGALFPLNVLFLFPWAPEVAYAMFAIVCAWLGALGYFLLARRLIRARGIQLLAAVLYASTGFFFFHAPHLNVLGGLAVLPWMLHFFWQWAERGQWKHLAGSGLCGALIIFSGHPEFALAEFLTLALFSVLMPGSARRRLAGLAGVAAIAVGVSAVQWLPTIYLQGMSERGVGRTAWINGSVIQLQRFLYFLLPLALSQTSLSGSPEIKFCVTSVGSFIALLSAFYVKGNAAVKRLWAIGVIALVLGTDAGYSILATHVPILGAMRDISRFALPAFVGLPLLLGLALEQSGKRDWKGRLLEGVALLVIVVLLVPIPALPFAWVHLPIFAGLVALWAAPWRGRVRAISFLVGLEVMAWAWVFVTRAFVPAGRVPSPLPIRPPVGRIALAIPYGENPVNRILQRMLQEQVPATTWLMIPQAPIVEGYESAQSDLQMDLPWFPGIYSYPWNHFVLNPERPLVDFLRLAGVTHLISSLDWFPLPREGEAQVFDDLKATVYRIPDPVRNVMLYPLERVRVLPEEDAKIAGAVLALHARLMETLYVTGPASVTATLEGPAGVARVNSTGAVGGTEASDGFTVEQFTYRGSSIEVQGRAEEPGVLLISATYAPGWTATVNGAPASLVRAQYQFMAVQVPAGEVRVSLRYVPPGFRAGAWISLISLFVLAAGLLVAPVNSTGAERRRGHLILSR